MHPAYFAMVMATGIVSLAAHLLELAWVAYALFVLNVMFAVVLTALTFMRIVRYPSHVIADFLHHGRTVGFLTTVAAASVLGSQFLLIAEARQVATVLWYVAIVLWGALTYTIFTVLTVKAVKPSLAEGINGGWLVAVVAPQSIAVLGAQLAAGFGPYAEGVLLFCLTMWLGRECSTSGSSRSSSIGTRSSC